MNPIAKRPVRALLAALLLLACVADLHADNVRYYREGAVPDPDVVARILGKPARKSRGMEIDLGTSADGGETLSEARIGDAAAAAVQDWKQNQAQPDGAAEAVSTAAAVPAAPAPAPAPASAADALGAPQAPTVPPTVANAAESAPTADTRRPAALALAIRFANGSARLGADARAPLDAIAEGLRIGGLQRHVVIEGHANATGPAKVNKTLSQARAEAVRRYLIERGGIPEALLSTVGYGQEHPLAGRSPAAPENRRVQFRPADA